MATASRLTVLAACAATVLAQTPARAEDPTGNWMVADRTAQIKVEPCGEAGYYGMIDWEKVAGVDANNRDPNRRGKPMLGVAILIGMKPAGANEWHGHVYNPKDGGTYFARLKMAQANMLRLEGCILGGLFCGGETWTRMAAATTGAAPGRGRSACPQPPARAGSERVQPKGTALR